LVDDLHALIRFHRHGLDEKRKALAALLGRRDALRDRIQALEDGIAAEAENAKKDFDAAMVFGTFAAGVRQRQALIQVKIDEMAPAIDHAEDMVAEAFRELKTYEIAQQGRDERAELARKRLDGIVMDEAGSNAWQRNNAD
jgi:flagellar biosynthesis chaperone FliJ